MNSPSKENQVFEYLRDSQTELSPKQVQEIIKRLPSLPVPKGGHPHTLGFNFYSIIMNSIIAISLMSGVLFLLNPKQEAEKIRDNISIIESSPEEEKVPESKQDFEASEKELPLLTNREDREIKENRVEEIVGPISRYQEQNQVDENRQIDTPSKTLQTLDKSATSSPLTPIKSAQGNSRGEVTKKAPPISFRGKAYYRHMSPVQISEGRMKELKKILLKTLRQDKLMPKGKPQLTISHSENQIEVNDAPLAQEEFSKYKSILENYGVVAGLDLRLIDKFILVGEFTENGQLIKGILEGSGYIKLTHLAYNPKTKDEGLFSSEKEGLLSLGTQSCKTELEFQGDITKFKEELLKNLLSDDLLSSEKGKNRLWFPAEGLAINKTLIPASLQKKYASLLTEYNIDPCKDRLIQMTENYIAVGDIQDKAFKGRMRGSIDLDELNDIELSENIK